MQSPGSPPGPALGPALREGLKLGPGPSPIFKARARPELVFLGPDPSLIMPVFFFGLKSHAEYFKSCLKPPGVCPITIYYSDRIFFRLLKVFTS